MNQDTLRLPRYRSSYLLRYHPYARVKPSMRERLLASNADTHHDVVSDWISIGPLPACTECNGPVALLEEAIYHPGEGDQVSQLRRRRLSLSSVVVDLAFMIMKRIH
ncbi:hypothetical protein BDN67DRAFT_966799 [Paxillus ammoniavirescens]|nr:hypothetical protein BDN67DRAFT_966799 [Paxillus ammoniavirescens]